MAIPAFPGAEGFGSNTPGGRGGIVIQVSNLNDSGFGSFRDALIMPLNNSPRIIIFKVGGVINALTQLNVIHPFTTIAGQTAPGDGIVITGSKLAIKTHDVIVRGLKSRVGIDPHKQVDPDGIGTIADTSSTGVYNVIVDHNSITWGIDENAGLYDGSSNKDKMHDITFSWNMFAEALYCSEHRPSSDASCVNSAGVTKVAHSMGFLLGDYSQNITLHHNLLASNHGRNPLISSPSSSELINNVIYNWGEGPTTVSSANGIDKPIYANIIGNYYEPKNMSKVRQNSQKGIYLKCDALTSSAVPQSKVHVKGNIGPGRLADSGDEWGVVTFESGCDLAPIKINSSALPQTSGVKDTSALVAYTQVLDNVGAVTHRDSVDSRILSYVKNHASPVSNTRWFVDSPNDVGGSQNYPTVARASSFDTDSDGLPNTWDTPDRNPVHLSKSGSGYTWIEEYINSLISNSNTQPSPPANPSPTPLKPGDLNEDGIVDIFDFNLLITKFGVPYTIFDFNNILINFNK